jgi:rod shape-determining protein MreD
VLTSLWLLPLLALLQTSLFNHFALRGIIPGIVLIVVVNWGILRGMDEGLLWALIGGVCLDAFSSWPFGTNTVALVIVVSLVSLGEGTFMRTHALVPPITVFAATIVFYGVVMFILVSTQRPVDWFWSLRNIVVLAALYNAALNIGLFRLSQRLEQRIYPVPRAHW